MQLNGNRCTSSRRTAPDAPAYSVKDILARMGVRTIPKEKQVDEEKIAFFFGYKLHLERIRSAKYLGAFRRTNEQAR